MRYNGNELKHMALSFNKSSKEGTMYFREKEGKLWNKTDVLTPRWCRLVGNLLFYFKTQSKSTEPVGVYILENCKARLAEHDSTSKSSFVLEFVGDSQLALFHCSSSTEAKEWIHVINQASYAYLRKKYLNLKKEIKSLKQGLGIDNGSIASNHFSFEANSSGSSPTRKPGAIMAFNENFKAKLKKNSLRPILEISLECINVQVNDIAQEHFISFVRLHVAHPPSKFWSLHSQTEQCEGSKNPKFMSTISFYYSDVISLKTWFRFSLYCIKSGRTEIVGSAICVLSDLLHSKSTPVLPLQRNSEYLGGIRISLPRQKILQEPTSPILGNNETSSSMPDIHNTTSRKMNNLTHNSNLKSLFTEAISRTYQFPSKSGKMLNVQEIMLETLLSFHIPLQYLKLCIDEESGKIGALESLGTLNETWEKQKSVDINSRKHIISQYNEQLKHLTEHNTAPYFKASVQKADKELNFIPINLHLQRMVVYDSADAKESSGEYDFVTVGATSVHSFGFKQGGLLSLLQHEKKSSYSLSSLQAIDEYTKFSRTMSSLNAQILYSIKKLKSLVSANQAINEPSALKELNIIGEKMNNLINSLSTPKINEALEHLALAKVKHQPNSNLDNGLLHKHQIEWEDDKVKVRTMFNDILKHTESIVNINKQQPNTDNVEMASSLSAFSHSIEVFLKLLSGIVEKVQCAVTFHNLKNTPKNYILLHRRDIAFSHAISLCACGVATKIYSNIDNLEFLKQISLVGILFQVESLISTYGSELGMLQDYIVGVFDLNSVTVQCVCAEDDKKENLLPTIHGTRDAINIKLHLDPLLYQQLPANIKSGQLIKVKPVLFNIGVNEEQSLAETFGSTALQEYINMESLNILQLYYDTVQKECPQIFHKPQSESTACKNYRTVDELMHHLSAAIHSKKNKNVDVLQLADEICHELNGVRVTSCKSAKDRTAMAVTLEQAKLLVKNHNLQENFFRKATSCMRSEGTRRENTLKNTGSRRYAFTYLQLKTFPQQYRPPDGTYGKGQT